MTVDQRLRTAAEELRRASHLAPPPLGRTQKLRASWAVPVAAAAAVLMVVGVVFAMASRRAPSISVATGPAGGPPVFQNAAVTSTVTWHGHLLAAGAASDAPCTAQTNNACAPDAPRSHAVVWIADRPSGPWTRVWTSPFVINPIETSAPAQSPMPNPIQVTIVVERHQLSLLSSWMNLATAAPGSTYMWNSTDATHWHGVTLPHGLATHPVLAAVYGHGRLLAVSSSGILSNLTATAWTSTNGATWKSSTQGLLPFTDYEASLAVTSSGYLLGGGYNPPGRPAVWSSRDGINWTATPLPPSRGYVTGLAVRGATSVAVARVQTVTPVVLNSYVDGGYWQVFVSHRGGPWKSALIVADYPDLNTADLLVATDRGFVAVLGNHTAVWSADPAGGSWVSRTPTGLPGPAQSSLIDAVAEGPRNNLIVFGHRPLAHGTSQLWVVLIPTKLPAQR